MGKYKTIKKPVDCVSNFLKIVYTTTTVPRFKDL